jgi:uncharacterized protein
MDKNEVRQSLKKLANDLNVSILFAVEIGSRAYEVQHEQSDYDIGVVYKHNYEKYLYMNRPKDAFHLKISSNMEVHGWDIYKVSELLLKSNASLYEWLNSDVTYIEEGRFIETIKQQFLPSFSKLRLAMHYYQMTKNNLKNYQSKQHSKLLYQSARCYLMVRWLSDQETLPPIKYLELLQGDLSAKEQQCLLEIYQHKISNKNGKIYNDSLIKWLEERLQEMFPTIKTLANDKIALADINELLFQELNQLE